jgi:hypothetical protein
MDYYNVFIRTWWKRENGKLVPHCGRKTYITKHVTRESARSICEVWNNNHNPGTLSRKAEFQKA